MSVSDKRVQFADWVAERAMAGRTVRIKKANVSHTPKTGEVTVTVVTAAGQKIRVEFHDEGRA